MSLTMTLTELLEMSQKKSVGIFCCYAVPAKVCYSTLFLDLDHVKLVPAERIVLASFVGGSLFWMGWP